MEALGGTTTEWLPGYRVKVMDGNHILWDKLVRARVERLVGFLKVAKPDDPLQPALEVLE